jgi:acetylornithine/succinyldiaminopimelate/putrescine aminotransferase
MAKGMGNGMPIGAVWARREIAAAFKPGDHGSTFSGTAIATAAARATIAEMERIDAPKLASERGDYLRDRLKGLAGVQEVRGAGLLLAIELAEGLDAKSSYTALLEGGLITNAVTARALRLAPPINVSTDEIDEAIAMMKRVIG